MKHKNYDLLFGFEITDEAVLWLFEQDKLGEFGKSINKMSKECVAVSSEKHSHIFLFRTKEAKDKWLEEARKFAKCIDIDDPIAVPSEYLEKPSSPYAYPCA